MAGRHPLIEEVRGAGLIWGLALGQDAAPVVNEALARGVIVNRTAERVVRLLPPLVITEVEIPEEPEVDEKSEITGPRGRPTGFEVLPAVQIGEINGLLEMLHREGGREDAFKLAAVTALRGDDGAD